MDTIKYLELAVSKDVSRYNMEAIYRDINCMVATDGHRLHLVGGLATIDKPHFLNGLDAEFPNYNAVLPANLRDICELKITKSEIKQKLDAINDNCADIYGAVAYYAQNGALVLSWEKANGSNEYESMHNLESLTWSVYVKLANGTFKEAK
jgi:hypothetical protein